MQDFGSQDVHGSLLLRLEIEIVTELGQDLGNIQA
jgi:hypothetical protein